MSYRKNKWTLLLRGDHKVIEVVLRDQDGLRASKQCTEGQEVESLLVGWEQSYGCETSLLLQRALEEAAPEVVDTIESWSVTTRRHRQHRCLNSAAVTRALELAQRSYRPKEIRDLKADIASETRAAEFLFVRVGIIDPEQIERIVQLKLALDGCYGAWAEGKLN